MFSFSYRISPVAASKSSYFCEYALSLHYPEHLEFFGKSTPLQGTFTGQLPVAAFKCQLFFLKRKKQKQLFITPLTLIHLKSCNCIKIKILFIHDSEKTTPNLSSNFFNLKYEKPLYVCFLLLCLNFPLNFCRRH